MGDVAARPATRSVVAPYSDGDGLTPLSLSGDGALGLVLELCGTITRQ